MWFILEAQSRDYYISPKGNDISGDGSKEHPYASLTPFHENVQPGDNIIFRGGTYKPIVENSMGDRNGIYSCAFILDQ